MLPDQMNTVEIREFGGPDVLEMCSRPLPEVKASEVLVKVASIGVNGPDLVQRRGHYPPPPGASDLLGLEVSGEVVAVGADVSGWAVGDTLCALTNGGGYADYVAIEASHCLPIPKGVDIQDAAGLPETYFTVWSNFFLDHPAKADDIFLVHGGAGGIGSTAIQLGAALGLRVFATAGNADALAYCESLGAERAINYKDEDFVEVVKAAGGANLILDIIGGDYIARNIKASAPDARIVQLAFNGGAKAEINFMPIMLKRLTLTGSTLRSRPAAFKSRTATSLRENAWPLFDAGKLKPQTYKTYPMAEATAAHSQMEKGGHKGKLLLIP